MNDRYFDEFIKVKLETYSDASVVDEAALEEVLMIAEHIDPGTSWWNNIGSSGNWLTGLLSSIVISGALWWSLSSSLSVKEELYDSPPIVAEESRTEPEELKDTISVLSLPLSTKTKQTFATSPPRTSASQEKQELTQPMESPPMIDSVQTISRIQPGNVRPLKTPEMRPLSFEIARPPIPESIEVPNLPARRSAPNLRGASWDIEFSIGGGNYPYIRRRGSRSAIRNRGMRRRCR